MGGEDDAGAEPDRGQPRVGPLSLNAATLCALLLVGTVCFRYLEHLSWLDAAYCTTGIITTVGQVIVPRSAAGRAFTAVFNIASLGLGVIAVMDIADQRRDATRKRLRRSFGVAGASASLEVLVLLAATLPPLVLTAALLQWSEGWASFGEALYFCLIVATGLGMGDVEPKRPLSRAIFIVYLLSNMGVMLTLAGTIGNMMHESLRMQLLSLHAPTSGAPNTLPRKQQAPGGASKGGATPGKGEGRRIGE